MKFSHSRILGRSKEEIIAEYSESSRATNDFERGKWGSDEGMLHRFRLTLEVVDWTSVDRWLDIGCGSGRLFATIEEDRKKFKEMVGIDITAELIDLAKARTFENPTRFYVTDLETLPVELLDFDLVTMIGVLQLCGMDPIAAIGCAARALRPGGQLFLTTKNLSWCKFSEPGYTPDQSHSWFSYEDLEPALKHCGITVCEAGGFLPREGARVPMAQSHTLYILGRMDG